MDISLTKPKLTILRFLKENPIHGYQLAAELDRHESPIYQHLNQLEADGLVKSEKQNRRKIYEVTKKGQLILDADRMED